MNLINARPFQRALLAATAAGMLAASGTFFLTEQSSGAEAGACPSTTLTRTGAQTTGVYQNNTDGTWNLEAHRGPMERVATTPYDPKHGRVGAWLEDDPETIPMLPLPATFGTTG